jgi:hypothetical protein
MKIPTNNGEEFREVLPLHPGYFVSNQGRIWSEKTKKFLALSPLTNERRENQREVESYYYGVALRHNSGQKRYKIHTLVGRYFLPDYEEGLCILHNREDLPYPEINYLSNLRVGTRRDNNRDMYEKGRRKRTYYYNIQGKRYETLIDIQETYRYTKSRVLHRVLSDNYPDWVRIPV